MSHKPDYDEIARLEAELFPEWFEKPKPPRRRAPGREEEIRLEPGAVWAVTASAASPIEFRQMQQHSKQSIEAAALYGANLRKAKIYDRYGRLL